MPIDPYDPSGDDADGGRAPDIGDVIRRIIGDRDDSGPTPTGRPAP